MDPIKGKGLPRETFTKTIKTGRFNTVGDDKKFATGCWGAKKTVPQSGSPRGEENQEEHECWSFCWGGDSRETGKGQTWQKGLHDKGTAAFSWKKTSFSKMRCGKLRRETP